MSYLVSECIFINLMNFWHCWLFVTEADSTSWKDKQLLCYIRKQVCSEAYKGKGV